MDMKTRFEMQRFLEQNLHQEGDLVRYEVGWNDAAVARKFGCSRKTVAVTRSSLFGNLRNRQPSGSGSVSQRLAEIERRLDAIDERLAVNFHNNRKSNGVDNATESRFTN